MMPAFVHIPIVLPSLQVIFNTSGCIGGFNTSSFKPFNRDYYPITLTGIWRTLQNIQFINLRLIINQSSEVDFIIQLGSQGVAGAFNIAYQTAPILFQGVDLSWMDLIQLNYTYPLYNTTGTYQCNMTLQLIEAPVPYELIEPDILTSTDYALNKLPRKDYLTAICNYAIGRLDHALEEFYEFLPELALRGGYPVYVDPLSRLPVYVPPDPTLDYRFDCNEFYPKNESFLDYNIEEDKRSRWDRMSVASESCFSPFVYPEAITNLLNPDEEYIQCQKLGGYVIGRGRSLCSRPITQLDCKKDAYYFNERCFHKFNPTTDSRYAVPLPSQEESCIGWNSYSHTLIEVDIYLDKWLQDWFVFIRQDISQQAYYRVPQFGSNRCLLYSTNGTKLPDQSCYDILKDGNYIFPICYYSTHIPQIIPRYKDQAISLRGAQVRVYGQIGPLTSGAEALCTCFDGTTDKNCESNTCPVQSIIEQNPDNLNVRLLYFQQCYQNKQGSCYMTNAAVCKCNYPYGPDSSIISTLPALYQFKDFPCSFPAAPVIDTTQFIANDVLYTLPFPLTQNLPCSGVGRGKAVSPTNSSGAGYCVCDQRVNILNGGTLEDASDGRACSCNKPIIPFGGLAKNGLIQSSLCNDHGTCCPFGENIQNPFLGDIYSSVCDNKVTGCGCDNGHGGASCTCPVPFNLNEGKLVSQIRFGGNVFTYINLGSKNIIYFVKSNCSYINLCNEPARNASCLACLFNANIQIWECMGGGGYQYIQWGDELDCEVESFSTYYNYCGRNETINPFSGRFFQINSYRDYYKYQQPQPFTTAAFGCTDTDCMCGPDWGGGLCNSGVSSVRLYTIEEDGVNKQVWAKQFCGENTLVPNLFNSVSGRGQNINGIGCQCNAISSVDPTGRTGRVVQQFKERGCVCATGLNQNTQDIDICAGHGRCKLPSFPYAWCEIDVEDYKADSLYNPFISSGGEELPVTMILEEDSYFLGYTSVILPTSAPVPTVIPTKNPTKPTQTPTHSPTIVVIPNSVILFSGGLHTGNMNGITNMNTICNAVSRNFYCSDVGAFASSNIASLITFAGIYDFTLTYSVRGPTNTLIATEYQDLFEGPFTILINSLLAAGASVYGGDWWSGTSAFGGKDDTCTDWVDDSISNQGSNGDTTGNNQNWLMSQTSTYTCDLTKELICICVQ
jgi:hypothetical protein